MKRRLTLSLAAIALLAAAASWWHLSRRPAGATTSAASSPASEAAVPQPPAGVLRPVVEKAVDTSSPISWEERLDLVRNLPSDLGRIELNALLDALVVPRPDGVSPSFHSSYLHEIACVLQGQPAVLPRFADALTDIAKDTARDEVSRDYALQHLRQAWQRAANQPALRDSITGNLRALVSRNDPAVSVSALLSLHLLGTAPVGESQVGASGQASPASGRFEVSADEIEPLLGPLLSEKANPANLSAKLTAARIVGERRLANFRQPLLALLNDHSEHAMVRMAAANALGRIGDPGDIVTLAALDPGDDRVAAAIRYALDAR
jgi:hypothetical protein